MFWISWISVKDKRLFFTHGAAHKVEALPRKPRLDLDLDLAFWKNLPFTVPQPQKFTDSWFKRRQVARRRLSEKSKAALFLSHGRDLLSLSRPRSDVTTTLSAVSPCCLHTVEQTSVDVKIRKFAAFLRIVPTFCSSWLRHWDKFFLLSVGLGWPANTQAGLWKVPHSESRDFKMAAASQRRKRSSDGKGDERKKKSPNKS